MSAPGEKPDDLNKTEYSEIQHNQSNGQRVAEVEVVTSQEQTSQTKEGTSECSN